MTAKHRQSNSNQMRYTLFYFKRTKAGHGGGVTTEFGIGTGFVWALVLLALGLAGNSVVGIPSVMSLLQR
jgi:hypothetical protein